jgi:hypothetical protein
MSLEHETTVLQQLAVDEVGELRAEVARLAAKVNHLDSVLSAVAGYILSEDTP